MRARDSARSAWPRGARASRRLRPRARRDRNRSARTRCDANGFLTTPTLQAYGSKRYLTYRCGKRCSYSCSRFSSRLRPSRSPTTPQNGTLSIREGRGIVQVDARGSMTGRVNGKIAITDPKPYDSKRPVVYGSTKTTYRNVKTTRLPGQESPLPPDRRAVPVPHPGPGDLPERDRARHRHHRRLGRSDGERLLRRRLVAERLAVPVSARHSNEFRAGVTTGPAIAVGSGILKGRCP